MTNNPSLPSLDEFNSLREAGKATRSVKARWHIRLKRRLWAQAV
jgi:hypothetical protein